MNNTYLGRLLLMTFCLLSLTMCQSNNKRIKISHTFRSDSLIKINIDSIENEKQILFSSVFKGLKVVPLETGDKCLIGDIVQLEIHNNIIYVLDQFVAKALFLFDIKGKFIMKIGAVGKGPGEYISPKMFSINLKRNQIQIFDSGQNKILIFSGEGKFINQIKLNDHLFNSQIALQNDITYIEVLNTKYQKSEYLLYTIGDSGKVISRWFPSQIYSMGFEQPFNFTSDFFKTKDDIKYTKFLFDTVFSVKGTIIKPYIVVSTKNKITSEVINKMNSYKNTDDFSNYYAMECDKFLGVTNFKESKNLIMFRFKNNRNNHQLLYWRKSHEVYYSKKFIDDITNAENFDYFHCVFENQYVSSIKTNIPERIEKLIKNLAQNNINISEKELVALGKLTTNSNPVILFFECREDMNNSPKY